MTPSYHRSAQIFLWAPRQILDARMVERSRPMEEDYHDSYLICLDEANFVLIIESLIPSHELVKNDEGTLPPILHHYFQPYHVVDWRRYGDEHGGWQVVLNEAQTVFDAPSGVDPLLVKRIVQFREHSTSTRRKVRRHDVPRGDAAQPHTADVIDGYAFLADDSEAMDAEEGCDGAVSAMCDESHPGPMPPPQHFVDNTEELCSLHGDKLQQRLAEINPKITLEFVAKRFRGVPKRIDEEGLHVNLTWYIKSAPRGVVLPRLYFRDIVLEALSIKLPVIFHYDGSLTMRWKNFTSPALLLRREFFSRYCGDLGVVH